jgi:hypothetical protein
MPGCLDIRIPQSTFSAPCSEIDKIINDTPITGKMEFHFCKKIKSYSMRAKLLCTLDAF